MAYWSVKKENIMNLNNLLKYGIRVFILAARINTRLHIHKNTPEIQTEFKLRSVDLIPLYIVKMK